MSPVERVTDRFAAAVLRLRLPILIVTALATALFGYFLKDLRVNADILSYLPAGDPAAKLNRYVGERFGGSQTAVVILEGEDVFSPQTLQRVAGLTEQLQLIDGVQFVTSLTNVLDVKKVEDGLEIGPLVDERALEGAAADGGEALRRYTLDKEMYNGRLVSADGKATIVVCQLREEADEAAAAGAVRRAVLAAGLPERTYFAGLAFQLSEINRLVQLDFIRLVPLAALLIVLALALAFRSLRGVLLPLAAALISTVWTLGVMSLARVSFSVVTNIIPVVLLAVGSAYGIHVVAAHNEQPRTADPRRRTTAALGRVLVPVLLAALTTIAGFVAFLFGSYLTMIREFGVFSALGVLFALLLSVSFVPAVLSYLGPTRQPRRGRARARRRWLRVAVRLRRGLLARSPAVLALGAVLTAAAVAGVPRLVREVDILSYFPRRTEVRLAEGIMKERFGGSTPLQVLVEGDVLDPAVLQQMQELEGFLRAQPQLDNVHSIVELFEEMNDAITDRRGLPRTREEAGNLWFLLEGDPLLARLVGEGEAVIQATVNTQNSRENTSLVRTLEAWIDEHPAGEEGPAASFRFAGTPAVYDRLDRALKQSLGRSLIISVALIFLCNVALVGSVAGGLLGMVPVGFALVSLFGTMGFAGIPLDIVTVLLGSISMGIGIDYSLHFLSRFRLQCRGGQERERALEDTLATTGVAILVNATTVAAGFLTLTLGTFIPIVRFGLLVAVTMASSGLGALSFLPAAIRVSPRWLFDRLAVGGGRAHAEAPRRGPRRARPSKAPQAPPRLRVPWPPRLKPVPLERSLRKETHR